MGRGRRGRRRGRGSSPGGAAASGSYARLGSRSGSLGLGRPAGGATGLTFGADEIVGTKPAGPIKEGRPAIGFRQTDANVMKVNHRDVGRFIPRCIPRDV